MLDSDRVLRPLREAEQDVSLLGEDAGADELGDAILRLDEALARTLRLLLRNAPRVPEELRRTAMSEADLPWDRLVEALRSAELISIELAGGAHELRGAAERATAGDAEPSDAEVGLRVARQAALEVRAIGEEDAGEVERDRFDAVLAGPAAPVPATRLRGLSVLASVVALLVVGALAYALFRPGLPELDEGIAAFRADDTAAARVAFEEALERRPENLTALLYMARLERRAGRFREASAYLGRAVRVADEDPDVNRELGHLFLAMEQAEPAARYYERAVEADPDNVMGWVGLVTALRRAGDPRAETMYRSAPPEARATLDAR